MIVWIRLLVGVFEQIQLILDNKLKCNDFIINKKFKDYQNEGYYMNLFTRRLIKECHELKIGQIIQHILIETETNTQNISDNCVLSANFDPNIMKINRNFYLKQMSYIGKLAANNHVIGVVIYV